MSGSSEAESTKLTIVAQFQAKPGGKDVDVVGLGAPDALEALLLALVDPTRAEKGCEVYDLHRSVETDGFFHFHEIWTSRADWDAHMESRHIAEFRASSSDFIETAKIFQLEQIR